MNDERHARRLGKYLVAIDHLFYDLVYEVALLLVNLRVKDKLFRFKDYPRIAKQSEELFDNYKKKLFSSINTYTEYEWGYGIEKVNNASKDLLLSVKDRIPSVVYVEKLRDITKEGHSKKALEVFQSKKNNGFTISERVWKVSDHVFHSSLLHRCSLTE